MGVNFSDYSDVDSITDLAGLKEQEYRSIDTTGQAVVDAAVGTAGFWAGVATRIGLVDLGAALAAAGATGKTAGTLTSKLGVTAGDIADAIDAVQHELSEAQRTGNWNAASLTSAVARLEAVYPEQTKFSGLPTTPDLVAEIKQAIENKSLSVSKATVDKFFEAHCFPAGTPVLLEDESSKDIKNISIGDIVLAFDPSEESGRCNLTPKRVVRIYHSITYEWVHLSWHDGCESHELITTPGHYFLDETGSFMRIDDLLRLSNNSARLIDGNGKVVIVQGECIYFSKETENLFERASTRSMAVNGSTVFKEEVKEGWRTYNFEVEDLHTYVAGGIRVHNQSGWLGHIGNQTDERIDVALSIQEGSFLDKVTDVVTAPFHFAGEVIDGIAHARDVVSAGFTRARDLFAAGDVVGALGAAAGGIAGAVAEVAAGVARGIGEVADRVGAAIGSAADAIADVVGSIGSAISDAVDSAFGRDSGHDGSGSDNGKPVIIDLDGDGVEINVSGQVSFDMDGDGYKERTSWADADDGFLVVDFNADGSRSGAGDGKITQTKELVLTEILGVDEITDLQALSIMEKNSAYGGNNDGVLNARDALWQQLKIWQDSDQDGEVDAGEMRTLDNFGIRQINLRYDGGAAYSNVEDDVTVFGNTLLGSASYTKSDGTVVTGGVGDVALSYNAQGWRRVETALGYEIQFEAGNRVTIAELEGKSYTSLNLDAEALDGAVGDARANSLTANGHSRSVQISGGDGDDVLIGGENDDLLSGDAGADQIRGMGGNDLVFLDAADLAAGKLVTGDAGIDTAYVVGATGVNLKLLDQTFEGAFGSEGNDTLDGRGLSDDLPLWGGNGNDIVYGGDGDDNLSGDAGSDLIHGGNGDDRLSGADGNDTLNGNTGSDVLSGGTGNDSLDGGLGDDVLLGGAGADSLNGSADDDRIDGGDGNDTLDGQEGDDFLTGGAGDDRMTFWYGDDTLAGEAGNDTFLMQQGDIANGYYGWTVVQGGQGFDTLVLPFTNAGWWKEEVYSPTNQWAFFHQDPTDAGTSMVISIQDIEKVQFSDGSTLTLGTDTTSDTSDDYKRRGHNGYDGDSSAIPVDEYTSSDGAFNAYMGNDYMNAIRTYTDYSGEIRESALIDFIRGMSGSDTILAGAGNDRVWGEFGDDAIRGDAGDDSILGGSGSDQIWAGAGNDTIQGDAGADVVSGGAGNDLIDGEDGSDILTGDEGNDTLNGGMGADLLTGGEHDDILRGGTGADRLYGEAGHDRLEGEAGADVLSGGAGNDTLVGGDGFNILSGDEGDDNLAGGADDDLMSGGIGADMLNGGLGRDTLIGGAGADILNGSSGILDMVSYEGSTAQVIIDLEVISGTDTLQSASGGDAQGDVLTGIEQVLGSDHNDILTGSVIDNVLVGGKGNDRVNGMEGHDDLAGGEGNDTLSAGIGDDRVWGDAGDDSILGSWGQDTIYGGSGYDILDYSAIGTASSINLQTNQHTGVAAGQMIYQVENVIGTLGHDTIRGNAAANLLDGHDGNDILIGGLGADTLDGGTGGDTASYEFAAAGVIADLQSPSLNTSEADGDVYLSIEHLRGSGLNDTLRGGAGANWLHGGDGGDLLDGREGNDALVGEGGNDTFLGGVGADSLYGGDGIDRIQYSASASRVVVDMQNASDNQGDALGDVFNSIEGIFGSAFDDWILGDDLAETLWGHTGDDHLYGRDGDDKLVGGAGNDTIDGGLGKNTAVYEGTAAVAVNLANGNSTGGQGNDILVNIDHVLTGAGNDNLNGNIDANSLNGGAGNDTIFAWGGSDRITGGAGTDLIRGGVGDGVLDTFVFTAVADSAVGTTRDTIEDFVSGIDRIDLAVIDANATVAGDQSFLFGGTTAKANAIWYAATADGIIVRADTNGNTSADFEVFLKGVTSITGNDFVL